MLTNDTLIDILGLTNQRKEVFKMENLIFTNIAVIGIALVVVGLVMEVYRYIKLRHAKTSNRVSQAHTPSFGKDDMKLGTTYQERRVKFKNTTTYGKLYKSKA